VFTTTFFAPSLPAGVVIEIVVDELLTIVAGLPSTVTEVAVSRLVPLITVLVPPAVVPSVILSEFIAGTGVDTYVNPFTKVVAPLAVERTIFLAPRVPAGVVTNTDVELSTTIELPATPPNEMFEVADK
jgi:hypothetical protein